MRRSSRQSRGEAAINRQTGAGDEAGLGSGKVSNHRGNILCATVQADDRLCPSEILSIFNVICDSCH
jgi:hypothetical protein